MNRILSVISLCFCAVIVMAQEAFGDGQLSVQKVADNAVRIQYTEGDVENGLPDWLYVKHETVADCALKVTVDAKKQQLVIKDRKGKTVFTATRHQLKNGEATCAWSLASPDAGQYADFHPHAHFEQGLRHPVEQLRHDGIQSV